MLEFMLYMWLFIGVITVFVLCLYDIYILKTNYNFDDPNQLIGAILILFLSIWVWPMILYLYIRERKRDKMYDKAKG